MNFKTVIFYVALFVVVFFVSTILFNAGIKCMMWLCSISKKKGSISKRKEDKQNKQSKNNKQSKKNKQKINTQSYSKVKIFKNKSISVNQKIKGNGNITVGVMEQNVIVNGNGNVVSVNSEIK